MPIIRREQPTGAPDGVYDVFYYARRGKSFQRDKGFDRDTNLARVVRIHPEPTEVAEALCKSQPGGLLIFGSAETERAWDEWQKTLPDG